MKKRLKSELFKNLPHDCCGHIVTFLSSPKDFLSICRSAKGFYHYVKVVNPGCCENIEFEVLDRWSLDLLPKTSLNYVRKIKSCLNDGLLDSQDEICKILKSFPCLRELSTLIEKHHGRDTEYLTIPKDDRIPGPKTFDFGKCQMLNRLRFETYEQVSLKCVQNLKELSIRFCEVENIFLEHGIYDEDGKFVEYSDERGGPYTPSGVLGILDFVGAEFPNLTVLELASMCRVGFERLEVALPSLKSLDCLTLIDQSSKSEKSHSYREFYSPDRDVIESKGNKLVLQHSTLSRFHIRGDIEFALEFNFPILKVFGINKLPSEDGYERLRFLRGFQGIPINFFQSFGQDFSNFPFQTVEDLHVEYFITPKRVDEPKKGFQNYIQRCRSLRSLTFVSYEFSHSFTNDNRHTIPDASKVDICVQNLPNLEVLTLGSFERNVGGRAGYNTVIASGFGSLKINSLMNLKTMNLKKVKHMKPLSDLPRLEKIVLKSCNGLTLEASNSVGCRKLIVENANKMTLQLSNFNHLHELKISHCHSIVFKSRLPNSLSKLDIGSTDFEDVESVKNVMKCPNLTELELRWSHKLVKMIISECEDGKISNWLNGSLMKIRKLKLESNFWGKRERKVGLLEFDGNQTLEELILSEDNVSRITNMDSLQKILVGFPSKENEVGLEISNLPKLEEIDLVYDDDDELVNGSKGILLGEGLPSLKRILRHGEEDAQFRVGFSLSSSELVKFVKNKENDEENSKKMYIL